MTTHAQYERYRDNCLTTGKCYSCGQPSDGFFRCVACRNLLNEARAAKRNGQAKPPTTKVNLTEREITLLRLGLMERCTKIKNREDMKSSYDDSITLLGKLYDARKGLTK